MNQLIGASQGQVTSVSAIVYPACCCGQPWPVHRGNANCVGYVPVRPVEDYGVVAYRGRRLCQLLHVIEDRCRRWRMALEKKG